MGRDFSETSAPPSLHKNSIYNKTLSWLRNLRTSSNKNRNNLQSDSDISTCQGDDNGTNAESKEKSKDTARKYIREGGGSNPPRSVSQDCISSHSMPAGPSEERHYYQPGASGKYRHSVIGRVTPDKQEGDSPSTSKDYFKLHYPRIKLAEPPQDAHQAVVGPPSSQESCPNEDFLRSSTSRGSKRSQSSSTKVQHRHSVIGDVSYVQDYQQHQHYHNHHRHYPQYAEGPLPAPDQTHGFSREQRTFSLSTQGIDNPGFSESSADASSSTGPSDTSEGASHRSLASSVGSTVTRILRARLFGRAKSSISLHLDRAPDPPSSHLPLDPHPHPQVHPRPSASVSALNLGTDYNISAVKLRPKKGQGGDSKHVYVVNKDTKPSRPRSCATLPRDAKLGKAGPPFSQNSAVWEGEGVGGGRGGERQRERERERERERI